jgi:hypothetical protein
LRQLQALAVAFQLDLTEQAQFKKVLWRHCHTAYGGTSQITTV